jgi:uncharacterized protein
MFGFSFYKLLVLVAVVAAVWYGFKFIGRLQDQRAADQKLRAGIGRRPGARGAEDPGAPQAEEMIACPVCQAYVPARNTTSCGRADCPY